MLPLKFISGLPYLHHWRPTDKEIVTLPHLIRTSDASWDPSVYDDHDLLPSFIWKLPSTPLGITDDFYDSSRGPVPHGPVDELEIKN